MVTKTALRLRLVRREDKPVPMIPAREWVQPVEALPAAC
jgi:hypothetical protein